MYIIGKHAYLQVITYEEPDLFQSSEQNCFTRKLRTQIFNRSIYYLALILEL